MAQLYGIYGQIIGKEIISEANLIELISLGKNQYVSAIAIHTDPTREVIINGSPFYIDERGTIEFQDVKINSLKFIFDDTWPLDNSTVITFAITEQEEY